MRRSELLISEARQESDNTTFSDESGIQDSEFLRWSNNGQTTVLLAIQKQHPDILLTEVLQNVTVGQAAYDIPAKTLLGSRIRHVEFSDTGRDVDYYPLKKGSLYERIPSEKAKPSFYIRKSSEILIQPPPDTAGVLRINFQKRLPRIDKRRATVSSATLDGSNNTITSLILDTTVSIDDTVMQNEAYITIVDKDGNILMEGIPITAVDITTGVVTVDAFNYQDGETIPSGSYVCAGVFSSNVSQLDDVCEHFLVEYMIWRAGIRDSSQDVGDLSEPLKQILGEILEGYSEPDEDVQYVPVLDSQFLTPD